ncbi:related to synaptic vesicle transporter SVOP and related transporters (major facilitator superfamily) [Lecanosticta acicola]|uniref:Related to synaptic vesicle transporter SVOP and related transporters (Major facilitator superfamily) n=1 Tax=Lecanosticta acicola TaxID=111012 RepID=A0AAI8YRR1_9PEZI|nr:related to synaptic vesicle transporter SVOP and related transporters (major facilitator superfamily) [Lecanosticta acicola]
MASPDTDIAHEHAPSLEASRANSHAPLSQPHGWSISEYNPESTASSHLGVLGKDHFLIDFAPNDPGDPHNWSTARKWLQVCLALYATLALPLNGTSITIAADAISHDFGITDTPYFSNSYWVVSSWALGGAFFVVTGLPLFEDMGVRPGFLWSYAFMWFMIIPQALAPNYATLIITRFFTGGAVAAVANSVSAMIADLWDTEKDRTLPVSIYILFYVWGDSAGPAVFAAVTEYIGNWRWIFYIQLIIYGAPFPLLYWLLREVRPEVILRTRSKKMRKETGRDYFHEGEMTKIPFMLRFWRSTSRPLYLLFTEPVLFAATLWSAFALGLIFLFTQSVEQVFQGLYGWTEAQCGYVQGAVLIGQLFGWGASTYGQRFFFSSADRNLEFPGEPIPEARLYTSVFGSFFGVAGGMFLYGWTSYPHIHWIFPTLGLAVNGFGTLIVVYAAAEYVVDAYADSSYAGSALAAVAFGENIICAFLPLASQSMYTNLGFQWASTLIGFLALGLGFAPVVFIWKGRDLRERSPFMRSAKGTKVGSGVLAGADAGAGAGAGAPMTTTTTTTTRK